MWNGSEAEGTLNATNSTRGATRGFVLGRQPGGTFESETITAGLAPDGVYVYAEWGEGRRNRPLSQGEHGCPDRDRTLEGKPAQSRHNLLKQEFVSPLRSS